MLLWAPKMFLCKFNGTIFAACWLFLKKKIIHIVTGTVLIGYFLCKSCAKGGGEYLQNVNIIIAY